MKSNNLEFVEDATMQARTPKEDAPASDTQKWYRERWNNRDYEVIVDAANNLSPDESAIDRATAYCYQSMALRTLGRHEESVVALLKAIRASDKPEHRARLYNMLANRIESIAGDYDLAELIAAHAWSVSSRSGRNRGWGPLLTVCEMKLEKARLGRIDMDKALQEVDQLMAELLDHFQDFEKDQEFINYMHRNVGIREYRRSDYWKRRFGHTEPK